METAPRSNCRQGRCKRITSATHTIRNPRLRAATDKVLAVCKGGHHHTQCVTLRRTIKNNSRAGPLGETSELRWRGDSPSVNGWHKLWPKNPRTSFEDPGPNGCTPGLPGPLGKAFGITDHPKTARSPKHWLLTSTGFWHYSLRRIKRGGGPSVNGWLKHWPTIPQDVL